MRTGVARTAAGNALTGAIDGLRRLRRNRDLFALGLASVVVMAGQGLVVPVLPLFAADFGVTTSVIGLSVSLFGAARLVLNVPLGILADRYGRRPILLSGPVVIAVSMVGAALSPNIVIFLLWRSVGGAGSAMFMTGAQLYLADVSTPANRARNIATNYGALWLGVSIGPALGGFVAEWFGLAAPFYVVGGLALVAAIHIRLRIPESRPDRLSPPTKAARPPFGQRPAVALLTSRSFLAVATVGLALFTARAAGQQALMPLHAIDGLGMSTGDLGLVFSMIALVNLVALAPAAMVADRFGRKRAIVPASIVSALGLAVTAGSTTASAFIIGCLVYGLGISLAGPAPVAYTADIAPPQHRGLALGLYRSVGDLGFTLGPVAMGAIADASSIGVGLYATAGFFALAAVAFGLLARETAETVQRQG